MIIVDTALRARELAGNPIRVGMVGAGFMGKGLANQIVNSVPGMRMVAISNRNPKRAADAFAEARTSATQVATLGELEDTIRAGGHAYTDDPFLLCQSEQVDVICEVTGDVEYATHVVLEAFRNGKDVVLMNAELDATIGPILQRYADEAGVILSACDGDEPGVQMNLHRWVTGLGFEPRVMGNVKGLQDPYRNPTTQQGFAEQWGQNPSMVTSFADGSKISFEQSIVANATGFTVLQRGMSRGEEYRGDVMEIGSRYDVDRLRELGGIVDYVVGTPHTKVYCLAEHTDSAQRRYLDLYKMGKGPLYPFFIPYHLVHFEVPFAIARVALFRDSLARPLAGPTVEVCAVAKRDLQAGEVLDDYGMYATYGEAVASSEMDERRYLPEGLVVGCTLERDIAQDDVITYADVTLPPGRLADRLRGEQLQVFRDETWLASLLDDTQPTHATSDAAGGAGR